MNSVDSILERNNEWEDETTSISLVFEGRKDETFTWDKGLKVEKRFLRSKESNEEKLLSEGEDWSFLVLEDFFL